MENDEYKIMRDIEMSYWWFVGRRYLLDQLLAAISEKSGARLRMLDIGCGTGGILALSASRVTAYGVDVSAAALNFSKARGLDRLVQCDINQTLPFKNDTFSVVTCLDVLEHLAAEHDFLRELGRICKPGGTAIFTIPAFDFLWSDHDTAVHHLRRYTRHTALKRFEGKAWELVKASYFNTVLFFPILAVRKFKNIIKKRQAPCSDFFIPLPRWGNGLLTALFKKEVSCLRFLDFPFGVSLLLVFRRLTVRNRRSLAVRTPGRRNRVSRMRQTEMGKYSL